MASGDGRRFQGGTTLDTELRPLRRSEQPDFIAPIVGYLSSKGLSPSVPASTELTCCVSLDNEETSGALFEILGGWAAQTRWQRSGGYGFPTIKPFTIEDVVAKWGNITNFGGCNDTFSPNNR